MLLDDFRPVNIGIFQWPLIDIIWQPVQLFIDLEHLAATSNIGIEHNCMQVIEYALESNIERHI